MRGFIKNTLFENEKNSNYYFEKHFHDTYTIGLTYSGFLKSYNLSQNYDSYQYSCRINNPGEMHGGCSTNWNHVNFYPRVELLVNIYEQIFLEKRVPFFRKHIIDDKILFLKLDMFFNSIQTKNDMLIESNLIEALSYLVLNYTTCTKNFKHMFDDKKIIKETLNFINESIEDNITLDSLAKNSSLSKFHFLRVFKKELGMTPHSFIINERINRANALIQNGTPISLASTAVGFNDQSHFSKNFKKYFGYSPKKSNFIL
ncbi:MAG: AraC family transcriptional regulator [Sulfurospirillaceae bacterium]|nr:AraC family transcriptional regulator [Sulfurospirillaceae bacterium]